MLCFMFDLKKIKLFIQQNEASITSYIVKIKSLEDRVKDSEHQATEATKKVKN